ncbi:RagB/SusD family nutrient uptake outer membrane protein [Parapedobacter indicus]|uniref:Starch-binding associating with outer membrane n=1 Tax=Parapedobacter indicus TaxID=1477437 RepID=A0A1I3H285_9SPHI|nr:RagB/SusD family nutrient uptake outer membrane protein [Parapedobacter indicus]PPL02873.1 putative outer membrane starch-binding protein [Parapedobacter indicus]SFI29865.1 Starch-binding associating with outer membrane [Parapedobacter indicus]
MKRKYILIAFFPIILSCTGLLDENPETFIDPNRFYRNIDEATAATYGIYDMLPSMYRNPYMTAFADVSSNSFKVTSASATDFQPFDIHSISSSNDLLTNFWEASYRGINRANAVLDRISNVEGDQNRKNEIVGEAKFLRALFYFNLVRLFGDVPLSLHETVALTDLNLARTPLTEVYHQIVDDLLDAKNQLPAFPRQAGRADLYAATALLSKVYLTIMDYPNAAKMAEEVILSGKHDLWGHYREAFLEKNDNGKESIFAVQFRKDVDGLNLNQWALSPLLNSYVAGGSLLDLMEITDELLNGYEEGDQRKDLNAVSQYITADNKVINFQALCFKYTDGIFTDKAEPAFNNAGNSGVNYQILRYADVLLIFAEAQNEISGPTPAAYDAINRVRRRAFGLPLDIPSRHDLMELSKETFREAIWQERFLELPFEGNQWFDLIRTGRAEATLDIPTEKTLYPIPQREIDVNNQLIQNPGYN